MSLLINFYIVYKKIDLDRSKVNKMIKLPRVYKYLDINIIKKKIVTNIKTCSF